jgi:hypothetical protein
MLQSTDLSKEPCENCGLTDFRGYTIKDQQRKPHRFCRDCYEHAAYMKYQRTGKAAPATSTHTWNGKQMLRFNPLATDD